MFLANDSTYRPHDSLFADDALARRIDIFVRTLLPSEIRVTVSGGRVHVQGIAITLRQRELVEARIRRVAGVLDVWNDLVVTNRAVRPSPFKPQRRDRVTPRPGQAKPASDPKARPQARLQYNVIL